MRILSPYPFYPKVPQKPEVGGDVGSEVCKILAVGFGRVQRDEGLIRLCPEAVEGNGLKPWLLLA